MVEAVTGYRLDITVHENTMRPDIHGNDWQKGVHGKRNCKKGNNVTYKV